MQLSGKAEHKCQELALEGFVTGEKQGGSGGISSVSSAD